MGETEGQETVASEATNSNDENTPGNKELISFDELVKGEYVAIHGNVVNGVFTARVITVYLSGPIGGATSTP